MGVISSKPPRLGLGIQSRRYSYDLIAQSGEFGVNLVDSSLTEAVHVCGSKSGRDIDKFNHLNLTPQKGEKISAPLIKEAPVSLECKLEKLVELEGTHDLFIGEVVNVWAEEKILNSRGGIDPEKADIITFGGGKYWSWGPFLEPRKS